VEDDGADTHAMPPGLVRALRADPDHAPELLMRFAVRRLGAPAARWAEEARARHPDATPAALAAGICDRTLWSSRLNGALAGTPFLIALIPAYVAVLWDEAWLVLRTAALFGHDVRAPGTTAELLVLRGIHPDVATAQAALDALERRPERRLAGGGREWWRLGRRVLVLAGFLDPPDDRAARPPLVRRILVLAAAGVLYAITWLLPLTFMIVMAGTCATATGRTARAALDRYGPPGVAGGAPPPRRHRVRTLVLGAIGGGLPIALVVWVNHQTQASPATGLRVVGALTGLSVVLALYGLSRRPG
jgi:hypothetical protein